jgi:hypothetical protein
MAEIKNKFVSWTLNVIREIEPPKFYGVGVNLSLSPPSSSPSRVIVSEIHPSGPASTCLQINDVILTVNNAPIDTSATPQDVAKLVRGPEGSEVDVVVEREGKQMEFRLRRERLQKMETVEKQVPKVEKDELKLTVEDVSKEVRRLSVEDLPIEYKTKAADVKQAPPVSSEAVHETNQPPTQDLASSNESTDKFEPSPPIIPKRKSFETTSEEKSTDELETSSIINSVDGEHWELLSATSGSAVVISVSGSFRSASPSILSNKFVFTESTGEEYMEHIVLPTDTLQGLCLAYKLSATRLRMINGFSGNSLQMAPKKLRIPTNVKSSGIMIRTQDKSSKEYKLYAFCAELPSMELVEAKAYLDLSTWDRRMYFGCLTHLIP